jgi:putative membrane protein
MLAQDTTTVPYCGPPPSPAALWLSWNFDPVLVGALAALACLYALGCTRLDQGGGGRGAGEKAAFYTGWLMTALALVSPLCPLSVSLFAVRVGQHMMLTLLAAPLVVAGRPAEALAAAFAVPSRRRPWLRPAPLSSAGVFAAMLWFWHAPAPYAATFDSTLVYWAMHMGVFGSAVWLWYGLFDSRPTTTMNRVAASVMSSVQMGFLGALVTLAPRPLYVPHALATGPWGLTALQDQQLGGGIMWVPGCLIFLVISLLALLPALAKPRGAAPSPRPTLA